MKKLLAAVSLSLTALVFTPSANAQDAVVQEGEFGIGAGAAHYFGDLNTRAKVNRIKPAATIFFRKNFGNYIAARVGASFAMLGYSDQYNTHNEYMYTRNLSFNTNVWELTLQGDFNFFRFMPCEPEFSFTPYITLGVGVFSYDPYAYINDKKEFLRPLGTEGQTIGYNGRKPYGTVALCVPFGAGIKYNLTEKINISFEIAHRYTFTDYLDDVSTTFVGVDKFPATGNGPTAALLQDRSYEIDPNNVIGVEGRQRGWSKQKDQYIIVELGVSFNFGTYRCPTF